MIKRIDLQGKKYGRLSVKKFAYSVNHKAYWNCVCDCGNPKVICTNDLRSGNTKSCGCLKRELTIIRERKDEVGNTYHRLTVKEFAFVKRRKAMWRCICDCGKETIVPGVLLRNGIAKSCGCLKIEKTIERNKQEPSIETRQKMRENHADFRGIKSGKWNSNLTDEDRINNKDRSYLLGYKEWRKAVLKRDNYVCQCCNKIGYILCTHHLDSYDNFLELRTVIENGTTLCKDCHRNFHYQYGNGNNTKEQFKEFIINNG